MACIDVYRVTVPVASSSIVSAGPADHHHVAVEHAGPPCARAGAKQQDLVGTAEEAAGFDGLLPRPVRQQHQDVRFSMGAPLMRVGDHHDAGA